MKTYIKALNAVAQKKAEDMYAAYMGGSNEYPKAGGDISDLASVLSIVYNVDRLTVGVQLDTTVDILWTNKF